MKIKQHNEIKQYNEIKQGMEENRDQTGGKK